MAAQQIGIVSIIVGHVVAVNADGVERVLAVGDVVYADEVIRTADAAAVTIEFNGGGWFDLGGNAQAVLDADLTAQAKQAKQASVADEPVVEDLQAAIEAGADPTAVLPPTAAGPAGGGAGEGGHSFIALDHDFVAVNPEAGIPTNAEPLLFENVIDVILPADREPNIDVSTGVDVSVGGDPGPGGVVLVPGGTPIAGGVSGASVLEGSDGEARQVTFLITLSQVSTKPVTVTYTIVPGTASNPDDYFDGVQTGTVTIPPGYIGFAITENIVADLLVEGNETFSIVLSNPSGATLTNSTATVTIIDDDLAPVASDDTNWVQEDNFVGEGESVATTGNVLQTLVHPGAPSATPSFSDAADSDDNPLILSWGSEAAQYGSITRNADGSYEYVLDNGNPVIQALSAGQTLTETFIYTITDGVNTPDTAKLTITIFGADDGARVVTASASGPDASVTEHGLTSVVDSGETVTGTFTVTATDGIASITVGGTSFTLAQMQAFATTPGVVNTGEGVLTLTGYDAGTGAVSYSYTLTATIDNDSTVPTGADTVDGTGFNDSVTVTVTGVGGSTASDALVIRAVDDTPTAVNDGPLGVTEDGAGSIGGNVLTNDAAGADTPAAFVGWSGGDSAAINALNTYGVLTQNGDGGWSYVLDHSRAATQALTASSSLSFDLHYTMKDADGDPSDAKLTITVTGADDGARVVTASASGPDASVTEHGLTSVVDSGETVTGTFTVTATDGIASITVGGTSFTLAQMQAFATTPGVVNTGEGVLTLTGYDAGTGAVSYSYTLTATIDNDSTVPTGADTVDGTGFNDSVTVTVTGVGGSTASDALVIRAVDDTPTASTQQLTGAVDEDGLTGGIPGGTGDVSGEPAVASGSVATLFNGGADVPLSYALADSAVSQLTALGLKSGGVSLAYSVSGDTVTATKGVGGASVFTFTLTAGGAYTFTLTGPLDHAPGSAENDLTLNLGGLVVATDADGDSVAAAANGLVITVDDDSPAALAPDPAAVLDINIAPTPFSLNLALGADGSGSAVFDIANNGMVARDIAGNLLKLDGQQLYLFGDGTGTLTGTTSSTGVGGTVAFTLTLDPLTNTYTVDVNGTISNGTEFRVSNLTSADAGNTDFRGIGADSTAQAVDILFSARSADGTVGTVNTSNSTIGVDSQSINAGAAVRMDFVTNLTSNGGVSGFNYTGHQSAKSFKQFIPQVQGNQDNTVSIVVAAIVDTTNDQTFPSTLAGIGSDPNESLATVTGVTVWEGTTARVFTADGTLGGITVDFRVDGTVLIAGLQEGDSYQIRTSTPFQAVLVEAPISNNNISFDLGAFSLETVNDRSPINLAYEVDGTDADGDAVSGWLSVALLPNNAYTAIGSDAGQTLNGDAASNNLAGLAGTDTVNGNAGNDFLLGGAGDDILVGGADSDVLYGQTGSDTLTGGIGGADSVSDRFVFQRGDVGHGVDTITDFKVAALGAGGDVLDIGDLLTGAGISPATFEGNPANYLVVTAGTNTTIAFDADGAGAGAAVQIATLQNVNTTLNTLLANGQIDATP